MDEQQVTPKHTVLLAGVALAVAAIAFGASFYYFDGSAVVADVYSSVRESLLKSDSKPKPIPRASETTLALPAGMPEEFALRLWQEQIESQEMIGRLVDGEITRLVITDVETSSADATLSVTAYDTERPPLAGVIGLKKFGSCWYVTYASARESGRLRGLPNDLPNSDEVDFELLGTILSQQTQSKSVLDEYVAGGVHRILMRKVSMGPRTATIDVAMSENHGVGHAQIVAIRDDSGLTPRWFLARFTKVGDQNQ